MKKENVNVQYHLKEKTVTIDGVKYSIKELENKKGKSKIEVSILATLHLILGDN